MVRSRKTEWRVEEWTKKVDPEGDNPLVAVPKPKPEGDE